MGAPDAGARLGDVHRGRSSQEGDAGDHTGFTATTTITNTGTATVNGWTLAFSFPPPGSRPGRAGRPRTVRAGRR
ncbi:cellulose binding domain-containing protein [Micromonospora deserti]|uniref:cellulose binding domain-containing protein n=1 Tax=Micromonospora deserti TaxID=2070366 RepID=UPI002D76F19B|nr:cellulose binding domain-containing protein [Micromonospora deserti]